MPELPEVETVARLLRPRLVGRTIRGADVRWERMLGGLTAARFRRAVFGARFVSVARRGKFLLFELARGDRPAGVIVAHLRMSGRMHVELPSWDPGPWVRLSLPLDDGRVFHFVDVRKFGRFVHARAALDVTGALGPEPLDPSFTAEVLASALRSRARLLKPLLLDQAFLAGVGNIYADESLHRAGLHPLRRSDRLTSADVARLHRAIRTTLTAAVAREGASFDSFYVTPEGQPGGYQDEFRVYGRAGEPCRRCGTAVRRIVVGQRGTHLCPRCQRAPTRRRSSRSRRRP